MLAAVAPGVARARLLLLLRLRTALLQLDTERREQLGQQERLELEELQGEQPVQVVEV